MTSNNGSKTWIPTFGDCDDNPSTGILIFHNDTSDAEIKDMHGCFEGIIITDKFIHINANAMLRGALGIIAANGNIGNGNADVEYSTIAITQALQSLYKIVSWSDSLN